MKCSACEKPREREDDTILLFNDDTVVLKKVVLKKQNFIEELDQVTLARLGMANVKADMALCLRCLADSWTGKEDSPVMNWVEANGGVIATNKITPLPQFGQFGQRKDPKGKELTIIETLIEHGPLTVKELMDRTKIAYSTLHWHLKKSNRLIVQGKKVTKYGKANVYDYDPEGELRLNGKDKNIISQS